MSLNPVVTLTPSVSKQARRELGLSQNDVIKAVGIQSYKLKQWEGRGLSIELADIRKLSDFYESQGVNLDELADHLARAGSTGREVLAGAPVQGPPPLQDGFTYTPRPGFMISDQLAPELREKLMERMEFNDDRIGELTAETFNTDFFGGISGSTEEKARELIGTLAENHIIFRCLQGRNIVSAMRDTPKTLGEFLTQMMSVSPVLPILLQNPSSTHALTTALDATEPAEAAVVGDEE